jgi:hypothetical protein
LSTHERENTFNGAHWSIDVDVELAVYFFLANIGKKMSLNIQFKVDTRRKKVGKKNKTLITHLTSSIPPDMKKPALFTKTSIFPAPKVLIAASTSCTAEGDETSSLAHFPPRDSICGFSCAA